MWHKKMQIAIVEQDADAIAELIAHPLEFETLEQMIEAQYLLAEATAFIQGLKEQSTATMKQLKKNIDFLKVSERKSSNRLDIRS